VIVTVAAGLCLLPPIPYSPAEGGGNNIVLFRNVAAPRDGFHTILGYLGIGRVTPITTANIAPEARAHTYQQDIN